MWYNVNMLKEKLNRDFIRARKAFKSAEKRKQRKMCIALHNMMVKIHVKLVELETTP